MSSGRSTKTRAARHPFPARGPGRLALGDTNYATHLRLARRSQERQHPVGVTFGEGHTITEVIRADNDVPSQMWEENPGQACVLFQGHDGVFRLRPEHPESDRLRAELGEALRQKARVWFIALKPDLALLDVLPARRVTATSPRCQSMAIEITDYLDVSQHASDLGLKAPEGACILPRDFARAKDARELVHESSALDLKTLFREADLPITAYEPDGAKSPYLQENDITWVGPASSSAPPPLARTRTSSASRCSVIANYVTDLFKGLPEPYAGQAVRGGRNSHHEDDHHRHQEDRLRRPARQALRDQRAHQGHQVMEWSTDEDVNREVLEAVNGGMRRRALHLRHRVPARPKKGRKRWQESLIWPPTT